MIVYRLENFLVNLNRIAFAKFGHELIFLKTLVVAYHLIAHVSPLCRTFLEYFSKDIYVGITFYGLQLSTLIFERQAVNIHIIAFLEDATLYPNHDTILVESLANSAHPFPW